MTDRRFDTIRENAVEYRRRWNFSGKNAVERLSDAYVDGAVEALMYSPEMVENAARNLLNEHLPGWDEQGAESGAEELLKSYMRDAELIFQSVGMKPEGLEERITEQSVDLNLRTD